MATGDISHRLSSAHKSFKISLKFVTRGRHCVFCAYLSPGMPIRACILQQEYLKNISIILYPDFKERNDKDGNFFRF